MKWISKHFLIFASLIGLGANLVCDNARASDVQFDVGAGYNYFAGQDAKSLAPNTGYLLRFEAESGRKSIFKWMSSLSLLDSQATSDFSDNGTTTNLSYSLMAGEFDLGVKFAFLASDDRLPVQPYVGGAGSAMSASFTFPANAAVSASFPKTDAENFFGYLIFVGVDVMTGRDWGFNVEVDHASLSGTVANWGYRFATWMGFYFGPKLVNINMSGQIDTTGSGNYVPISRIVTGYGGFAGLYLAPHTENLGLEVSVEAQMMNFPGTFSSTRVWYPTTYSFSFGIPFKL